jgi:uncharacterized protein
VRTTCLLLSALMMKNEAAKEAPNADEVIAATQAWIEKAVIGLNLCPFAKAVYVRQQIRYVVSRADCLDALLDDLDRELKTLSTGTPETIETTLLIHPRMFQDFVDYNDFLEVADGVLEELGLDGELQIASFHPRYQFADTEADDITNFTNRSPYPTLHLLREASVEAATAAFPETDKIYLRNIDTLRNLGVSGWDALGLTSASPGSNGAGS